MDRCCTELGSTRIRVYNYRRVISCSTVCCYVSRKVYYHILYPAIEVSTMIKKNIVVIIFETIICFEIAVLVLKYEYDTITD